MTDQQSLESRRQELSRRVAALPKEVAGWKMRTLNEVDHNLHFSQLQAIGILMDTFSSQQAQLLANMQTAASPAAIQEVMLELIKNIIRSQKAWDFFRDKLELRFSPAFKEVLWAADTVAWDCYRPVLDRAGDINILDKNLLREAPLTYLTADFSPATWSRGSRPNDGRDYTLGASCLPVPVIAIPWDHVENIWELMSIHHEVGHDLEADLKLRGPLCDALKKQLSHAGLPAKRIQQWLDWQGEIFADLVGLQLGGPAFAEQLMNLLLLPAELVIVSDPSDPHPTHYPRILMNTAYLPTLVKGHLPLQEDARRISDSWTALYGRLPQYDKTLQDFQLVYPALMDQPLAELKGKTVRDLLPYSLADDLKICKAREYLATGMNKPGPLPPRHCISAARLAVTRAAGGSGLTGEFLDAINQRTLKLVKENAVEGLHGGDGSSRHKIFIAGFADQIHL